jgi:hypothetical protein
MIVAPKFNYLPAQCTHESLVTEVIDGITISVIIVFVMAYALRKLVKF